MASRFNAGPELEKIAPALAMPFNTVRLKLPHVLWVNSRWCLSNNIDIDDPAQSAEFEQWLLDEFAYVVEVAEHAEHVLPGTGKTFYADRYGGHLISHNGGSGRVGISGTFQVKGIGKTPLVGEQTEFSHAHGAVFVGEAIKEAIFAELFFHEAPHSALPVVAIIDTGIHEHWANDSGMLQRRALVVRPSFLRPAHCQRALMFRPDRHAHLADAARVAECVRALGIGEGGRAPLLSLENYVVKLAEQVAFAFVQRLTIGANSSSNFSVDGAFVDFGAACSLPSWTAVNVVCASPRFGREIPAVAQEISSLAFYFRKYGGATYAALDEADLLGRFYTAYAGSWRREFLRLFGIAAAPEREPAVAAFLAVLNKYVTELQEMSSPYLDPYLHPGPTLYEYLFCGKEEGATASLVRLARALDGVYAALGMPDEEARLCRASLGAALTPREQVFRPALVRAIEEVIAGIELSSREGRHAVAELIRSRISSSRRIWPDLAPHLAVLGHVSDLQSQALLAEDSSGQRWLLLSGTRCGSRLRCFGADIPLAMLEEHGSTGADLLLPFEHAEVGRPLSVQAGGATLLIPPLQPSRTAFAARQSTC